jgi:hypothetical protein
MLHYTIRLRIVNWFPAPFRWPRCSNDGVLLATFPVAHQNRDALLEVGYGFLWFVFHKVVCLGSGLSLMSLNTALNRVGITLMVLQSPQHRPLKANGAGL